MLTIDEMINVVEKVAKEHGMDQTLVALPYAIEKHDGQYRKGEGKIPYIIHPLQMACHAICLGLIEDELLATILLHDICEDCLDERGSHIRPQDLPVSDSVAHAVMLLSKPVGRDGDWEANYYHAIEENRLAIITKLIDRCNNISSMAKVFSEQKMASYIELTEKYVMPYIDIINAKYPQLSDMTYVVGYHMESLICALKK